MTWSSEVVPVTPNVAERRPPRWRQRIEEATRLAVGVGTDLLGAYHPPDGALQALEDVALGVMFSGERVLLDGAELMVDTAAALVRIGEQIPPVAGVARLTMQMIEPVRRTGTRERMRALAGARTNLPNYVDRAVQTALDLVPLNEIMERVDVNRIVERVDVNGIVERADVNRIVERADVQAIVDRADVQGIVDRVDLNQLMSRIDVDAIVERTDIGAVIAQSTGGVTSGAVDLVRRQGVGLDQFVARWAGRVRPRQRDNPVLGPELLIGNPSEPSAGAVEGES